MQMSAQLRRNSVCGPGCAAIVAANGNAMHHLPRAQATCLRREEADERCSEGEHPMYFWLSRPPFRSRLPFTPYAILIRALTPQTVPCTQASIEFKRRKRYIPIVGTIRVTARSLPMARNLPTGEEYLDSLFVAPDNHDN